MKGKPDKVKKVYFGFFFGLMLLLGIAPVILFVQNHLPAKESAEDGRNVHSASVSFAQLYPFEGQKKQIEQKETDAPEQQSISGLLENYRNTVERITGDTESYLTENTQFHSLFRNLSGAVNNRIGGQVYQSGSSYIVKLSNGFLTQVWDYCPPSPELGVRILDFAGWLKEQGIPYVTLIQPDKSDDSVTVFPSGVPHEYARMAEEYKAFLEENGLPYLDAKQVLLADNEDLCSWFYKADHHWNVHAGYRMARETAEYFKEELSIPTDTDALAEGRFELAVYPDSFLGSYGSKLGNAWKEDMEVLYPKEKTEFHIAIPDIGMDRTGSFGDTLINQDCLSPERSSYGAFLYGDHPLIRIENQNCPNGTRILVIKYSFANDYCPYLAGTVQYLDLIDPRSFDGSIRAFIEQTKPDAVLLCMGVITAYEEAALQLQ